MCGRKVIVTPRSYGGTEYLQMQRWSGRGLSHALQFNLNWNKLLKIKNWVWENEQLYASSHKEL